MTKNELFKIKEVLTKELNAYKGFYFNRNIKKNTQIVDEYISDIQTHIISIQPENFEDIEIKINEYNDKYNELSADLELIKTEYNDKYTKENSSELNALYSPKINALQNQLNEELIPLNEEYKEEIDIYTNHNKNIEIFLSTEADDLDLIKINIKHVPDAVLDEISYDGVDVLELIIDEDED